MLTRQAASKRTCGPAIVVTDSGERNMLKFIGGTVGVIFLIGLAVVIGVLALIF